MEKNKIELLAPAGDLERAYFALEYGADAIYLGAKQYSLRARASNFELNDIKEIVSYAHSKNKKVYIVANIICHIYQIPNFKKFFEPLVELGVDGFIVADPFIFYELKKHFKNVELHVSTQQSITNSKAAAFFKDNGATRVILAREITYDEIKLLTEKNHKNIEIEIFIHGAVFISYSGRCMMSNNFSLRDANIGGCAQSCRWEYDILGNNNHHKLFTMSAKDMVYMDHLEKLSKLDIASFKIEGRMKTINYLTSVIKSYRQALDEINSLGYIKNKKSLDEQLNSVANRQTDDAFLFNADQKKMLYHDETRALQQDFLFTFLKKIDNKTYVIQSKNYFDLNMKIKVFNNYGPDEEIKIMKIINQDNQEIKIVNTPMTICTIYLDKEHHFNNYCLGKKG